MINNAITRPKNEKNEKKIIKFTPETKIIVNHIIVISNV